MDQKLREIFQSLGSIPPTRGDGPEMYPAVSGVYVYSPHAWGWTLRIRHINNEVTVFPTRVGMDHTSLVNSS